MSTPVPKFEAWPIRLDELTLPPFATDLSATESMADPKIRQLRARAKSATRMVLAQQLGINPEDISFKITIHGKPCVSGCEFSISHSGSWLVIATGATAVGVDVETQVPRRDPMELAERFFHPADTAALRHGRGANPGRDFLRQWVAKEAALKAAGTGLGGHLHDVTCVFENASITAVNGGAGHFSIHEFSLRDNTPGALAWRGESPAEIVWREPAEAGIS